MDLKCSEHVFAHGSRRRGTVCDSESAPISTSCGRPNPALVNLGEFHPACLLPPPSPTGARKPNPRCIHPLSRLEAQSWCCGYYCDFEGVEPGGDNVGWKI